MPRRSQPDPDGHTVTAVGTARPGSPLDRLFNYNECLRRECGAQAVAPGVFCASHATDVEAGR